MNVKPAAGFPESDLVMTLRARFIQALALLSIMALLVIGFLYLAGALETSVTATGLVNMGAYLLISVCLLVLVRQQRVEAAMIILVGTFVLASLTVNSIWLLVASVMAIIAAATLTSSWVYLIATAIVLAKIGLNILQPVADPNPALSMTSIAHIVLLITLVILSTASRYFYNQTVSAAQYARSSGSLLGAVAETGDTLARILNIDELLPRAVELIRERFAFYHVQIFLINESGDMAQLVASTGPIGQKLLERQHQLGVGSQSVIGSVTRSGAPVVARDTDPIYYRNELLPNTRSELALPIFEGERIIGALDVQSRRSDAFDADTVQALQVMANLLGTSIRNARLFELQEKNARETKRLFLEVETNLREMQRLNQQLTRGGWESYLRAHRAHGVTLDNDRMLSEADWTETQIKAIRERQPVSAATANQAVIAVPVMLGNEVIGAIEVEAGDAAQQQEALETIKAIADRLAISLDKARLFEESQEATAREQRINEIVSRYQTVSSVDDLLRITLAELSETLGATRGAIRLGGVPAGESVSLNGDGA